MTLLAIVHVPRTGGGSATNAVSRNYGRARSAGNIQLDPARVARALDLLAIDTKLPPAVSDHIPYGLYRRYLPPETRYVTFLRDPVERVLSHYWFHARQGETKLARIWRNLAALDAQVDLGGSFDPTLEEGLARGLPIYRNLAVRFLCGGESIFGPLPPGAIKRSRKHVSRFFFVGISERLDESLVLLGRALGVDNMAYVRRHVSAGKPPADDALRALVAEHNHADIVVYREARERFDEAAARVDGLAEAAAALRAESDRLTADAGAAQHDD